MSSSHSHAANSQQGSDVTLKANVQDYFANYAASKTAWPPASETLARSPRRNASGELEGLRPWQEQKAKALLAQAIPAQEVRIRDVAEACHLSRSHFSRAFKRVTGYAPRYWLLQKKIEHAQQLLSTTSCALADIGIQCGFFDQSHFSRVFTKATGKTPMSWRLEAANAPTNH